MRQKRAESEEPSVRVRDFRAAPEGPSGTLWRVNEIAWHGNAFLQIFRDQLIAKTVMRYDENGAETEITLTSAEAFDDKPVADRRTDRPAPGRIEEDA